MTFGPSRAEWVRESGSKRWRVKLVLADSVVDNGTILYLSREQIARISALAQTLPYDPPDQPSAPEAA